MTTTTRIDGVKYEMVLDKQTGGTVLQPVALATIELDRPEGGRGELYWHDGTIWCREPEGNSYSTEERCDPSGALDHIAQAWADWDLQWTHAANEASDARRA